MISLRLKELFFNPAKILRAIDRARRAALSRSANSIRDSAQASMPPMSGSAEPGRPPRMKSNWLRRSVRAAWDRTAKTALSGPLRSRGGGAAEERQLMHALEFGGKYVLGRRAMRRRKLDPKKRITVSLEARPFMGPALAKEAPNMPRQWAGAVKEY